MALGLHQAGFEHSALVEWDSQACDTLRNNASGRWALDGIWDGDVRDWLDGPSPASVGEIDLVAGGPPCQPFSLGGVHAGENDERNMFPAALDTVRQFTPKAVMFENVPGLMRTSFRPYFDYVVNQLREPSVNIKKGELWYEHAARVIKKPRGTRSLRYRVMDPVILNSADYGIPQTRRRVFIVAIRDDLGVEWSGLPETHSKVSLNYDQWVEETYWEDHRLPVPPAEMTAKAILKLKIAGRPETDRWRTVRDMLREPTPLPKPVDGVSPRGVANHIGIPGARSYTGHTGSYIDLPSKTMKAGVHGVCGGEAMIRFEDDSLRYLTVREAARVQGFPDDYGFEGARGTAMHQIGNAVAVGVARQVGERLRSILSI